MLSVADASEHILSAFAPLSGEVVSLAHSLGRVLAEDVAARVTQPPMDISAMDGYAVRAADVSDLPVTLRIVREIPAGTRERSVLAPGEAARIFTGAPLPDGADVIVIQEDTTSQDGRVTIREAPTPGRWIRRAGMDFEAGTVGLGAGRRLTARDVGLAAAMNHAWLNVRRRPRVAVLATGDEIVLPGDPLGDAQIISSNTFALAAFVSTCGGEPVNLGIAPDDPEGLSRLIEGAKGCDLLLTAGGASVGKHDIVREVLEAKGAEFDFWKVAMRPGKPLMFGRLAGMPVIGLPGNPVSGLVCATLFVKPAMARMLGSADEAPRRRRAILGCDLPGNDRREDYLRAQLSRDDADRLVATPFDRQDSAMLLRLTKADGLVIRPPHAPAARAGDAVDVVLFDDESGTGFPNPAA